MSKTWIKPGVLPLREEALLRLFAKWSAPVRTERVKTADAIGRILGEDVFSLCDKPVYRGSQLDGVGVKSELFRNGIPDASSWVPGWDYVRADTGDDFDDAFDAVIAIEDVEFLPDGGFHILPDVDKVIPGTNVSKKGDSIAKGSLLCPAGTRLLAIDLAAIAMGAVSEIEVYKKPVCAFIPTGSELIPLGQLPERGQTVNSNSILAKHMIAEMGAAPVIFPIVRDEKAALATVLDEALGTSDIVVLCAGTSKGEEDFSHSLLAARGESICHGIAAAPGRPLAIAIADGKPVINVAGPPMGCFNGLEWCVRAVVSAFFEQTPKGRPTVKATLAEGIRSGGKLFETFIRLRLEKTESGYIAHPLKREPGIAPTALRSEGLYITKPEPEPQGKGDVIEVDLLRL